MTAPPTPTPRPPLDVLILAGRRGGAEPLLDGHPGLASKALLPVGGVPMIARVRAALAGRTRTVWVSGLTAAEAGGDAREAPPADGPAAAVLAAVRGGASLPLLVTTADHALLTPAIVDAFLAGARETSADLAMGLARREVIEARFPAAQRTYLRFKDAQVSGCNLFYLSSERGLAAAAFWRAAEVDRKRPWRLARRIGPGVLLRYALGRLTLDGLFAHASRRLGATLAPVLLTDAVAAVDVDKPSDLALAEAVLAGEA